MLEIYPTIKHKITTTKKVYAICAKWKNLQLLLKTEFSNIIGKWNTNFHRQSLLLFNGFVIDAFCGLVKLVKLQSINLIHIKVLNFPCYVFHAFSNFSMLFCVFFFPKRELACVLFLWWPFDISPDFNLLSTMSSNMKNEILIFFAPISKAFKNK